MVSWPTKTDQAATGQRSERGARALVNGAVIHRAEWDASHFPPDGLICIEDGPGGGPLGTTASPLWKIGSGVGGAGSVAAWIDRREAELCEQLCAAAEDENAGDAPFGQIEYAEPERSVNTVAIPVVGTRGGLAIGYCPDHPPVTGGANHMREVA